MTQVMWAIPPRFEGYNGTVIDDSEQNGGLNILVRNDFLTDPGIYICPSTVHKRKEAISYLYCNDFGQMAAASGISVLADGRSSAPGDIFNEKECSGKYDNII